MDVTMAIGGIIRQQKPASPLKTDQTRNLKRRRSSNNVGAIADCSGSPIGRPATRRSLARRQSYSEDSQLEDGTMDLTMAIGGIRQTSTVEEQQDLTESSVLDATMDFTVAVGGIQRLPHAASFAESLPNTEVLEDMSMELTENLGKTLAESVVAATPSPTKRRQSPRKSILPSTVTVERPSTPNRKSPGAAGSSARSKGGVNTTPLGSNRKSPRKSLGKGFVSAQFSTPEQLVAQVSEIEKVLETPQASGSTPIQETAAASENAAIPAEPSPLKPSISDTIKLLLTPRKEILPTPAFSPITSRPSPTRATPKRSSPRKASTPRRKIADFSRNASPQKRVRIEIAEENEADVSSSSATLDESELEPISLQQFLNMTNIRFMDITASKRRATGYPGADGMFAKVAEAELNDKEPSMQSNVEAAATVVPTLTMYQHVSLFRPGVTDKH